MPIMKRFLSLSVHTSARRMSFAQVTGCNMGSLAPVNNFISLQNTFTKVQSEYMHSRFSLSTTMITKGRWFDVAPI
jgi:hypothetical protein